MSASPHKDRDGIHVKELGRDLLNLLKRKKKKKEQCHVIPQLPLVSSDTQKEDHSDPLSIHHLPPTSPTHSEVTQHSLDTRSLLHTSHSNTSVSEMTSTGATSGDTADHDNSIDEHKRQTREERRAHYRSQGIHVVADEDDHTDLEESPQGFPFRVDRPIIDRLQWKDGVATVELSKPSRPRFVKRKEEKLRDAIPLEETEKIKKKKDEGLEKADEGMSMKEKKKKEVVHVSKEPMIPSKEVIPIEDHSHSRRKSRKKKEMKEGGLSMKEGRHEMKDALPVEEKIVKKKSREEKKEEELKDAIPLEDKTPKKKKKEEKKKEEEDDQNGISRRKKKSRNNGIDDEEAIEDDSDKEKRRKKRGDEGMKDALPLEDRSTEKKKKSREEDRKREEKGKEEKKEEKKKDEKKEGDEGKKKDAKGCGEGEEENDKRKEKRREKNMKNNEEEDGDVKGERESREARKKEEEKIGEKENRNMSSTDRLTVVPYEEWPVPSLVETIDQYTGYRVLTTSYKVAYFGYVCMHVGYSFVGHLLAFDFTNSIPSPIAKKLTPSTSANPVKTGLKEGNDTSVSKPSSKPSKPSSTKRVVIPPVEYSSNSVNSTDAVDVVPCH